MTDLERKAREAAIDHGMWLAPDDNETNYQAFVAGYYRGWSDKGAYAPPRPKLEKVRELIECEIGNNGSRLWADALAELDAVEG